MDFRKNVIAISFSVRHFEFEPVTVPGNTFISTAHQNVSLTLKLAETPHSFNPQFSDLVALVMNWSTRCS